MKTNEMLILDINQILMSDVDKLDHIEQDDIYY